ncbi:MAG: RluA family pseudouridine synthase [Zetaproteobacteria bacterium]|nr:RluA family pseudouridine synthase [Zetaproteobacteria bacterium]
MKVGLDVRASTRVDKWLAENVSGYSRSQIQKMFASKNVTINGLASKQRDLVSAGDVVELSVPSRERTFTPLTAESLGIPILYEDRDILVIAKPPGLLAHPPEQDATLPSVAHLVCDKALEPAALSGYDLYRPGIVHRLDQYTSGVMVCALSLRASENLALQFRHKVAQRVYLALVCGNPQWNRSVLRHYLCRNPHNRRGFQALPLHDLSQLGVQELGEVDGIRYRMALGEYVALSRFARKYTLVRAKLYSGRTHQIRVQLAAEGLPLFGDPLYGVRQQPAQLFGTEFVALWRHCQRQLLHAEQLKFFHPVTGKRMEFEYPVWEDMATILNHLRPYGLGLS